MIKICKILYSVQDYRHKRMKVIRQKLRGMEWSLEKLYRYWPSAHHSSIYHGCVKEESRLLIEIKFWENKFKQVKNENHG